MRSAGGTRFGRYRSGADDFGTGYASLSHLNGFPLTWLKIDRSFVAGTRMDKRAEAIVQGALSRVQSLSILFKGPLIHADLMLYVGNDFVLTDVQSALAP